MTFRVVLLGIVLLGCCLAYMTVGLRGDPWFILSLRAEKLAALLLVAASMSTATLLFQTITGNRLLTPSIMGFDALYMLFLNLLVFGLGGLAYQSISPTLMMALNVVLLCGGALILFGTVLRAGQNDLMRLILTGVVLSVLFQSLTDFVQRMIDPNEFAVVVTGSFGRFSRATTDLLGVSSVLLVAALALAWRLRQRLDVLALGVATATSLGVSPRRVQRQALVILSALVAVSTALVGPVTFFGLLAVSLTYIFVPSIYHRHLLPAAALVGGIILVGGQTLMERALDLSTPLSVIVEFAGGLVFLILLLRSVRR